MPAAFVQLQAVRVLQQQECSPHSGLCSVAVLVPCQDVQVAVGCRVVRRSALQHHHPKVQIQKCPVSLHLKPALGTVKYPFLGSIWLLVISLSLDAFSPGAPQTNANLSASSWSDPEKVSKDLPSLSVLLLQCWTILTTVFKPFIPLEIPWLQCIPVASHPSGEGFWSVSIPPLLGLCFPGALQYKPVHQAPVLRAVGLPLPTGRTDEQILLWAFPVNPWAHGT